MVGGRGAGAVQTRLDLSPGAAGLAAAGEEGDVADTGGVGLQVKGDLVGPHVASGGGGEARRQGPCRHGQHAGRSGKIGVIGMRGAGTGGAPGAADGSLPSQEQSADTEVETCADAGGGAPRRRNAEVAGDAGAGNQRLGAAAGQGQVSVGNPEHALCRASVANRAGARSPGAARAAGGAVDVQDAGVEVQRASSPGKNAAKGVGQRRSQVQGAAAAVEGKGTAADVPPQGGGAATLAYGDASGGGEPGDTLGSRSADGDGRSVGGKGAALDKIAVQGDAVVVGGGGI